MSCMVKTIAICNQKGGVGKTSTAVSLSSGLALEGKKVLLIDLDPQGNATSGLGIDKKAIQKSIYHALLESLPLAEILLPSCVPGLDVIPANDNLAGMEVELVSEMGREGRLKRALAALDPSYEFVIIDCPPSFGLLTINALTGSHSVIIPIQCEYYALEGISQLLNTIRVVQQNFNPDFQIEGVLLTMFDNRLNLSKQVVTEAKEYFGAKVFRTVIPRNVRLAEAPSFGKPILLYDVQSVGAKSYLAVAQELMKRTVGLTKGRSGGGAT